MGIVRTISEHFIQIKYFQVKHALMKKLDWVVVNCYYMFNIIQL